MPLSHRFKFTDLIQRGIRYQSTDAYDIRVATGGSTTTFVDTTMEDRYGDEELKDGTLIVIRDVNSAAPEGEFARIDSYSEATNTITLDTTLSDGIGTGDTCMIILPDYPLRILKEIANDALRDMGPMFGTANTTALTTLAGITEYDLSVDYAGNNVIGDVYIQTNKETDNNQWEKIYGWKLQHHTEGETPVTLILDREYDAGYTIWVVGRKYHYIIGDFDDYINDMVPEQLAILTYADKLMQWHGVDDSNINYANKIQAELAEAKRMYKVVRPPIPTKFLTWGDS